MYIHYLSYYIDNPSAVQVFSFSLTLNMSLMLPAEIIDLIVETVSTSEFVPFDKRLISLALISSAWTHACQRVIFHSINLFDSPKNLSLLYALESRPILRSMTKRLDLRVFDRGQDDCILSNILYHLTHVETLTVTDYSSTGILPNSPSRIYEGLIHVVSLPSLRGMAIYHLFLDPLSGRLLLPFSLSCNKSIDYLFLERFRAFTSIQSNTNALLASNCAQLSVLQPKMLHCGQSAVEGVSTFLSRLNSPSCEIDIRSINHLQSRAS
ncbi:hypothetical protein BDQ12DRAFT_59320 [Crucibulum laeve]|uniref:Uncharacterized protein n=1 Tax=Crucibulum laeve TaxID=68775 RepID=A0A5C3M4J0_9AGAR|nr:hypothetical protein BDQ12DRAFT_59320 [Crucibulum laeve]